MKNSAPLILAICCTVLSAACDGVESFSMPDGAVLGDGGVCGLEGDPCAGSDCCGGLVCASSVCTVQTACLAATAPCANADQCCGNLDCGTTTLGQVCCGLEGETCTTANGEDCCGDLLCTGGVCTSPSSSCLPPTTPCSGGDTCCGGRTCGTTSLGQVCCGNTGDPCATTNGEDCCGALLCVDGVCGGGSTGGGPTLVYYPVRGPHNNGYDSTAGNSSLWSCDDANSNSDFVPVSHIGNDIWAAEGTPCVATVSGTLTLIGYTDYSGNKVTIIDDSGWYHFYTHLQNFGPGISPSANGTRINAGQVVGYVGRTGTAANGVVHLHYSIYPDGNYDAGIDPWPALHAVESSVCAVP